MPNYLRLPHRPSQAPKFTMTLNGEFHTLTVTWNVSAQRYYFNLYDSFGTWVVTAPLIPTAPGVRVSSLVYSPKLRSMVAKLVEPHWRPLGQIVDYTLEGVDPAWLNAKHRSETTGADEFVFYLSRAAVPVDVDPGQIALAGTAHRYVNLVEGYIENATLIFRNDAFEVPDGRQFTQGSA
jgi:hypothetical protein